MQSSNLAYAAHDIEDVQAQLADSINALLLITDGLSIEGRQTEDKADSGKAVAFSMRLPFYLSALYVIVRDLQESADQLNDEISRRYALEPPQHSQVTRKTP